jgi:hypothetical protein
LSSIARLTVQVSGLELYPSSGRLSEAAIVKKGKGQFHENFDAAVAGHLIFQKKNNFKN